MKEELTSFYIYPLTGIFEASNLIALKIVPTVIAIIVKMKHQTINLLR